MSKFFRLYKDFFNSKNNKNQHHLTPLELRIVIAIEEQKSVLREDSVFHIESLLFLMHKAINKRNKELVKEGIYSLQDKDIIEVSTQEKDIYVTKMIFGQERDAPFEKIFMKELHYIMSELKSDSLIYLYLSIKAWEFNDEYVSFSYDAISNICQVSKRTAQRQVKQLEDLFLIEVTRQSYTKNRIKTLGFKFCDEEVLSAVALKPVETVEEKYERIKRVFGE